MQHFSNPATPTYVAYAEAVWAHDSATKTALCPLVLQDPLIHTLVEALHAWPGPVIASHKSARQLFHALVFLADIGLDLGCEGIDTIAEGILSSLDRDGLPHLPSKDKPCRSPEGFGCWALCDAPSILYALKTMGVTDDRLEAGVSYLAALQCSNGYGCHVSPVFGSWHGPGKKGDPCPYATLVMLKLLIMYGNRFEQQIRSCVACLLDLWQHSREKHPYIFYMGTDFRSLKLPFIWYDILHVSHVLSQVPECWRDERFLSMISVIETNVAAHGYVADSIYREYGEWDFGQKRQPSPYLQFCVQRIMEARTASKP